MTPESWSALAAWAAVIVAIGAALWAAHNGRQAHNEAAAARRSGDEAQEANLEAQQANLDAQRAILDAQEKMATGISRLAEVHALPDVVFVIELGQLGNDYVLLNTGTHPATGVEIDPVADVHTERLPNGLTLEPGTSHTFHLVRSVRTSQLGYLAVKCNELPKPTHVPLPNWWA